MSALIAVTRLELLLFTRRRRFWAAVAVVAFLGLAVGGSMRDHLPDAWGQLTNSTILPVLFLVLIGGDGVRRDRANHLGEVLLSTSVGPGAYVGGKYLAEVLGLLGLSTLYPLACAIAYHPLGGGPYLAVWFWLVAPAVIAGAALMLAAMTRLRGQRVLAGTAVLLIWALPALAPGRLELLDLSTIQLVTSHHLLRLGGLPATPQAHDVARRLPPPFPRIFYANRIVLLVLSALCLGSTISMVRRRHDR